MKHKMPRPSFAFIALTIVFVGAFMFSTVGNASIAPFASPKAYAEKTKSGGKKGGDSKSGGKKGGSKKKGGGGGGSGGGGGGSGGGGSTCTGSSCSSTPTGSGKNCDKDQCDLVALYVNPLINLLSIVVGLAIAASLVMGGVQYSAAGSDPQKVSAAKSRISNTLLAFMAFAFLFAFLNFLIPGGLFQ